MKVAAVIPVHNRARVIGRAVQSALDQTYPLSEIIVVDDVSTDATRDVVARFSDPRIKIIELSHRGGACTARNVGWKASNADWIGFLDSDDIWLPSKIEDQIACIDDETVACFTGFIEIGNGSKYIYNPLPRVTSLRELQKSNELGPTSISLIKRSALQTVGGFDTGLKSCQDWDLWIRLRRLGTFEVIPAPLVQFEQESSDRISRNYEAVIEGHNLVFDRITHSLRGLPGRRIVAAMHAARMANIMDDFGLRKKAIYFAAKSFAVRPNFYALVLLRKIVSGTRIDRSSTGKIA